MNYEKFKFKYETPLAKIISDTWGYNGLSKSPEVALLMGKIYLYTCLCSENYNLVAVENDKPVGVIMGNLKRKRQKFHILYRIKQLYFYNKMKKYPEGKFILNMFANFDSLDKKMLEEVDKDYDGELVFFVTDSTIRGKHVGTNLYESLMKRCRENNCNNIYVYTDSTCNFGFYEHQGFVKVNEKDHSVYNRNFKFYLYEKEIKK